MKPATILLLLLVTLILTSCEKRSFDNPWDELSFLPRQDWSPKNLQIETNSIFERNLIWDYDGDNRIEGFKIDRKRGDQNWVEGYAKVGKDILSFKDTISPDHSKTYYYKVYANAGTVKSHILETNTPATIPAPSNLTFTINSNTSITLNWEYPTTGHEGFQLERQTNLGAWSVIASNINPEIFNYTDGQINLIVNDYAYRLRVYAKSYFSDYAIILNLLSNVTNPATGKTWMDRNLGASRVAQNSTDSLAYGDLYQWGRSTDGHQKRTSGTTSTLSSSDTIDHGNFILAQTPPLDWRIPQNNNFWQGINGINNPCPPGYRLPTEAEWEAERQSWSSNNAAGAFNSPLKLPVAGLRDFSNGSLMDVGFSGGYWSAAVRGTNSRNLFFGGSNAGISSRRRADGLSVRCIKD